MEKSDISYKSEELKTKFNFRVALIATNGDKILLQNASKDGFWSLIGGRVRLNEDTKSAIIREVEEEIGVTLDSEDLNLIKIIENFFQYKDTRFHEILYIYKADKNKELIKKDEFMTLDKENVVSRWIDVKDLNNIDVRPAIVKECYNDNTLSNELIIE